MKHTMILQEKGVALITVMLIIALATILAVSMSSRQNIDIHRSANVINLEQAYQYVLGAESWAKQILIRDSQDSKTDTLSEDWATVLPPLPIEGGQMSGKIEDLQARFNLNNLVLNGKPQKLQLERFKRLLRILEINENIASTITDWIDANEQISFSGAEDNEYLNLSPAYRTANQSMADVSELLLLKDIEFEDYEKLRLYVCVLKSYTDININTASAEVLSSVVKGMSLADANLLIDDRKKDPYKKVDDFLQHPTVKLSKTKKEGLSVDSQFFQLNSTVLLERISIEYITILSRENIDSVDILNRSRGIL